MKWCTQCGKAIADHAKFCPMCGAAATEPQTTEHQPMPQRLTFAASDVPSAGMNFLSFLWPLLGFILFLTEKKATPKTANAMGKWALIGFIVSVIATVIITVCASAGLVHLGNYGAFDGLFDYSYGYYNDSLPTTPPPSTDDYYYDY